MFLTPDDLAPFADIPEAKAQAMIADAEAMAVLAAPCISDPSFLGFDAVKAVLRGAILRWNDAGSGEVTQVTSGAFSAGFVQTPRKSLFWPSEIQQLQELCRTNVRQAFSIDTMPDPDVDRNPCPSPMDWHGW
jgi:hypothetical protein